MLEPRIRFEQIRQSLADVRPEALDERAFGKGSSRAIPYPQFRMLVGFIMYKEGYSSTTVGKCIGIDHSTVLGGCKNMEAILVSSYPPDDWIRECYRKTVESLPLNKGKDTRLISEGDIRNAMREVHEAGELSEKGYRNLCKILCI